MGRAVRQLWINTRHQNRIFWRTRIGAFFSVAFPLMMLVLFDATFGGGDVDTGYGEVPFSQFYVAGLAVFSAASATYTNIATNMASRRELGILKRVRGTPIPPWGYLGGVMLSAVWIAAIGSGLMVCVGMLVYGVNIAASQVPGLVLTFFVGAATFATLGVALAAVARSLSVAVAAAQFTLLPMSFVSDVFIPVSDAPAWLRVLGDIFPLKHFVSGFGEAMSPFGDASINWPSLGVMLLWMAAGALVAVRRFEWDIAMPKPHPRQRAVAESQTG